MKEEQRKIEGSNGITLIALVITIVILIILATVTINLSFGEGGLIQRAQDAKDLTEQATREEQEQLNSTLDELDRLMGENGGNQAEYTDIYVTLYEGGTLGFANDESKIEGLTPIEGKTWNITDKVYTLDEESRTVDTPWIAAGEEITTIYFVNEVVPKSTRAWFALCLGVNNIENISYLNTSQVTDMSYMFWHCESLESLDLSNFDTRNVTNMAHMFEFCTSTTSLDLSSFDTSNVTDMQYMFEFCVATTSLDLSSFDTRNVTNMTFMFDYCVKLENLTLGDNFDTRNVTNMAAMFQECSKLTSLDVSDFNTGNVTDMKYMFYHCERLISLNLSSFDTSNVTDMQHMFKRCARLTNLDISSFNTSKVAQRNNMFEDCTDIKKILVGEGWTEPSEADKASMFTNCGVQSVTPKNAG